MTPARQIRWVLRGYDRETPAQVQARMREATFEGHTRKAGVVDRRLIPPDPFGNYLTPEFPRVGTECFAHPEMNGRWEFDRLMWTLASAETGGKVCERCAIGWLLAGEAELSAPDVFAEYLAEVEERQGRSDNPYPVGAEHPKLARELLEAATTRWGEKKLEPLELALRAALRNPERAVAVRALLAQLLDAVNVG